MRKKSPTMARGMVRLSPMVTTRGVVLSIARTYRKSLDRVMSI